MPELSIIRSYHAHVYFDEASEKAATEIREQLGASFDVELGRWHHQPVGPHPQGMYQVAFSKPVFQTLVPWMMINRQRLSVLVHPNTGDEVADHTAHACWLGPQLELDIEFLQRVS